MREAELRRANRLAEREEILARRAKEARRENQTTLNRAARSAGRLTVGPGQPAGAARVGGVLRGPRGGEPDSPRWFITGASGGRCRGGGWDRPRPRCPGGSRRSATKAWPGLV